MTDHCQLYYSLMWGSLRLALIITVGVLELVAYPFCLHATLVYVVQFSNACVFINP